MSGREKKTLVPPINVIFNYLQSGQRVTVWLYDVRYRGLVARMARVVLDFKLEGKIIGFDEFMNVVMDDAEEIWVKQSKGGKASDATSESTKRKREYGDRTTLGRLLLKGENITLIQPAQKIAQRASGAAFSTQMED
ncbi:hypothetical protein EMMF5_005558 [Cystobasidiomycetes sp. EMM_F5]